MLTIAYHKSTGKTARLLAELLGLRRTKVPTIQDTVVIRWGSSVPAPVDLAINSAHAIAVTANGLQSLIELDGGGVPVPTVYRTVPEDSSVYPILGRRINHRGGLDIVWCDTPEDARNSGRRFFTRFFPVTEEFRVHVFGGEALRLFRKVPRKDDAHDRIRTSYYGWGYSRLRTGSHEVGCEIAVRAIQALGLTFGGVDMGYNRETGNYVVFEVNTAPALNSISALYYAARFEQFLVGQEFGYEPTGVCWATEVKRRIEGGDDSQ